jgi:hypothetical protein
MEPKDWVSAILYENALCAVDFHLGGLHVSGPLLKEVGDAIKRGDIGLYEDSSLPADAMYEPDEDTLYFKSGDQRGYTSIPDKSLIVHEAVHALIDINKATSTTILSAEVAAYLAQIVYQLASGYDAVRSWTRSNRGTELGKIYARALTLIDKYKMAQRGTVATLQLRDYASFRDLIHRQKLYRKRPKGQLHVADGIQAKP